MQNKKIMLGFLVMTLAFSSCGVKKKAAEKPEAFTKQLESGLQKLSEVAEDYSKTSNSDRAELAVSLDLLGYGALKSQVLGETIPKINKKEYPLQKTSMAYGIFGIKVLALKAGESLKASFNYTITSIEPDKCTISVKHSDFSSDSDTGPISVYYFGDPKVFGSNGPMVDQKFLAYVSYHASTIKIGIALPIIVIDGIERK